MPETTKTSMTLRVDQKERLEEMSESDDPRWDSQSDALRWIIDEKERLDDRVDDLEMRIDSMENEREVLSDRIDDLSDETDMVPAEQASLTDVIKSWFNTRWSVFLPCKIVASSTSR
jgi:chromosome segregation ATPase